MVKITEMLKAKNMKITPQRLAIYRMLINTDKHPCAEEVYHALKEQYPSISLATVYKNLAAFKAAGLVMELNTGEDISHYDANVAAHPHFSCMKCRRLYDIHTDIDIEPIRERVREEGFFADFEQIFFYGTCKHCKAAGES